MDAQQLQVALVLLASGGIISTLGSGIFSIFSRRTRTPEVHLAEAAFAVKAYQDQLQEARADHALNNATISTLRDYITKVEADGRVDQELITNLYKQIHDIEKRNAQKDAIIADLSALIDRVANKVQRGEPVTLTDLGRGSPLPDDLEDTQY